MKKLINEGFIGEIKWIYSNRLNMGKIRTEENVMWSFAPHDISLLISLVKSPIKNLSVQGTNLFNQNVEDATLSLFEFENGVKSISLSRGFTLSRAKIRCCWYKRYSRFF